jgi:hypothetical protein
MAMALKSFERLAGSMLLQAMADLKSGSVKHRGLAFEWLEGKNDDKLSFVHCCRMLGRDPEQVRGVILRGLYRDSAALAGGRIAADHPFVDAVN